MRKSYLYIFIIVVSLLLAFFAVAFKIIEMNYFMYPVHHKIYLGVTGIIFLSVGWFVNQFLQNKKLRSHEPAVVPGAKFDLTEREFEVLVLIARGYSNREIAEKLFLSLPTIKTHVSNLFTKLDVKRRTQAIKRARELKMIE